MVATHIQTAVGISSKTKFRAAAVSVASSVGTRGCIGCLASVQIQWQLLLLSKAQAMQNKINSMTEAENTHQTTDLIMCSHWLPRWCRTESYYKKVVNSRKIRPKADCCYVHTTAWIGPTGFVPVAAVTNQITTCMSIGNFRIWRSIIVFAVVAAQTESRSDLEYILVLLV